MREAIGPDIDLMCDINQRWRVHQAIDIGKRLEADRLFWLEDVTTRDDYAGLARVAASARRPRSPAASTSTASCRSAT